MGAIILGDYTPVKEGQEVKTTGKLLSVHARGSNVQMSTVVATIGIRGTGVYLEADPEQTYVCTCYGVTDISANNEIGRAHV